MKILAQTADEFLDELKQWRSGRKRICLVPGRCRAEDVRSMARIRDQRLYLLVGCGWEEFCRKYLGSKHRTADRAIDYLEEYGPKFFAATLYMGVTTKQYRKLIPFLKRSALVVGETKIALRAENRRRLREMAAYLLGPDGPAKRKSGPSIHSAIQRCGVTARMLRSLPPALDRMDRLELAAAVCEIRKAVSHLGVLVGGW